MAAGGSGGPAREHPLDGICTQLCVNLPAMAMGLPIHTLAGFVVFRGMWAIFVHSNVRLPLGPLRVLFGTYHCPEEDETYALGLSERWPKGYVAQLLHPLVERLPHGWHLMRQGARHLP